jgi:hypothetical protein
VEHLGCVIDSDRMRSYVAPRKIAKVHGIARVILRAGSTREAVGFEGPVTNVLWCVRLTVTGNTLCSLLHRESIRQNDQKALGRSSIGMEWELLPVESSVDMEPADMEEIGEHRVRWTPKSSAPNQIIRTDAADVGFG